MKSLVCIILINFLWVAPSFGYSKPGNPGPWGELVVSNIYLEAPDAVIDIASKPDPVPRWTFPGLSVGMVNDLLIQSGVDMEQVKRWYNGYNFLGDKVYNPFDILLFIRNQRTFMLV